ncbi:unnamed protein product [Protopolystoma xenopodis]|uniref:Uncharacterized protein n=1 Tax=Protopolystoma xenopodis TaxID=117903 RepID=A0A448XDZ9_9PLAT|nr:unnamed protein product [Protopolystoma xenopodis]
MQHLRLVQRMAALIDDADYDVGETFENVPSPHSDAGNHDNYYDRRLWTRNLWTPISGHMRHLRLVRRMAALIYDADYDVGETFENVPSPHSDAGNHDNYYDRRLWTREFDE